MTNVEQQLARQIVATRELQKEIETVRIENWDLRRELEELKYQQSHQSQEAQQVPRKGPETE